jgi:hypothetical protein
MRSFPVFLVLLLPCLSFAQDELPGPPSQELADPDRHRDAGFGTDLSLTLGGGSMLGAWSLPGVHSTVGARFDAFMQGASTPGPRMGLSIFGERAMGLLQDATELDGEQAVEFPFGYNNFGALCVVRSEPALPWGGNAGLGFSRLDLEPYYGGVYPVPVMLFEGGVRRALGKVPGAGFVDLGIRAGWTQIRNPSEQLEELWTLQLNIGIGAHLR